MIALYRAGNRLALIYIVQPSSLSMIACKYPLTDVQAQFDRL